MTKGWIIILAIAALVAFLGYVGPADYADALSTEADTKLLRAQIAGRSEHITTPADAADGQASDTIFPLLHPLGCGGAWIKKCADWEKYEPCETICLENR